MDHDHDPASLHAGAAGQPAQRSGRRAVSGVRAAMVGLLAGLLLLAACDSATPPPTPSTVATAGGAVAPTVHPPAAGTKPAAGTAWRTFAPAASRFKVELPGAPVEQTTTETTPAGALAVYSATLAQGIVTFTVSYADYPAAQVAGDGAAALLHDLGDEAMSRSGSDETAEQAITLQGYAGQAITAPGQGIYVRLQGYLVGTRLYKLVAVTPDEATKANAAERFLSSFRLVIPGK